MYSKFPHQLFPNFYYTGPPKEKSSCPVEGWGLYNQVFGTNSSSFEQACDQLSDWSFQAQHKANGLTWTPVESIVTPLLPPNKGGRYCSCHLPDAMDFPEHMANFYMHNSEDAFRTMSSLLEEHFAFGSERLTGAVRKTTINMKKMTNFLTHIKYRKCPITYFGKGARLYSHLLGDIIHDIPPVLLAELLHEELALQREQRQFNEMATGGALGYFPLTASDSFQEGCLVYPRKAALNSLKFHKVVVKVRQNVPKIELKNKPITYQMNGTVRQISIRSTEESVHIGVRTDYNCGVWMATHTQRPLPLDVVKTEDRATCISVSPHIPGELLVASERGGAYLWTVGRGLYKFREEDGNLYFNAQSPWRWCDFSAHPRVMLYADRTGLELTDIRSKESCSHTLFRIGETSGCKSGERVILCRFLYDVNPHQQLVTTQHSAYIMDERFPCMPMIKWDHMMADPPMFAQVVGGVSHCQNKVLLGSQRSQELMLLQYTGGNATACQAIGPPQKLLCPLKSLKHLPIQIPHRQKQAQDRLMVPAAGLASIYHGKDEFLCGLQLSEAGDIFYQMLRPVSQDSVQPTHREMLIEETAAEWSGSLPGKSQELKSQITNDANVGQRTVMLEMESVNSDKQHTPENTDMQMPGVSEPYLNKTLNPQTEHENVSLSDAPSPADISKKTLLKWKSWLNILNMQRPISAHSKSHWTSTTKALFTFDTHRNGPSNDQIASLKTNLKEVMRAKTLLTCGASSLSLPDVLPTPNSVEAQDWEDDLSQRLSVSWEGGWKDWWEEKLGLNREKRIEELRRKRKRQKQARVRVGLSGSFTSSVSYQSDLDDLSGWSSATSNFGDGEVPGVDMNSISQETDIKRRKSVVLQRNFKGSQLGSEEQNDVTLSGNKAKTASCPVQEMKLKEPKHLKQDYMSSLFSSQGEVEEAGMEENVFSLPMSLSSPMSCISYSQRKPSVGPSSQTSLSSQRGKKRLRMGF